MLIVDLIVAVCLAQDGSKCHDEHLYFESHGSLRQCMFEAMPAIAAWSGEHPQYRVQSFRCEWAGAAGKET